MNSFSLPVYSGRRARAVTCSLCASSSKTPSSRSGISAFRLAASALYRPSCQKCHPSRPSVSAHQSTHQTQSLFCSICPPRTTPLPRTPCNRARVSWHTRCLCALWAYWTSRPSLWWCDTCSDSWWARACNFSTSRSLASRILPKPSRPALPSTRLW